MKSLSQRMFHNILMIKPSSLGDVIRCLPLLSGLRRRYPGARISWLVRPDCAAVLRNNGDLDEIIEFDRARFGRVGRNLAATKEFMAFVYRLRGKRFDLVVDLQGLFRSGFLSFFSGAPVRMGFAHAREFAGCFYTHRITRGRSSEHIVESNWRFAGALGFGELDKRFELKAPIEVVQRARALLDRSQVSANNKLTVMLIGGTEASKRWPVEKFAALADELYCRYDSSVVLLGAGRIERSLAGEVVERAKTEIRNLVGETSVEELMAIMQSARLVVGNDSGPLHIAAAMAVPVVGLYGPTDPRVVGPYGPRAMVVEAGAGCRRRARYSRDGRHRIENITVEQVLNTIETLWTPTADELVR